MAYFALRKQDHQYVFSKFSSENDRNAYVEDLKNCMALSEEQAKTVMFNIMVVSDEFHIMGDASRKDTDVSFQPVFEKALEEIAKECT